MEIRIWEGGSSITDAGTLVYTNPITGFTTLPENTMAIFELNTPFTIDATKELRVGWNMNNIGGSGYPYGRDAGPVVTGKGDLVLCTNPVLWSGAWVSHFLQPGLGWNYNYSIKAYVTDGSGKSIELSSATEIPQVNENSSSMIENSTSILDVFANGQPAVVIPEEVQERAIPKAQGSKGIVGYRLWRLLPGQENNPDVWSTLTNNPVPAMEYDDYSWATTAPGTYKWAVRTSYHLGVESSPAFSNNLVKLAKADYVINISTNSGDSPAGANVTLSNTGSTHTAQATVNTVTFTNVVYGTYNLKVSLAGYHDYTAQIVIDGPGVHTATLIEIIKPPFDLKNEVDCDNVKLTWDHELAGGKHLHSFSVYLNDINVATGVKETEYMLVGLAIGDYTAGVQADYTSGSSEIVTTNFKIDCVGIDDGEYGYKLYPNPATNHIIIERENAGSATADIYNAMGMHIATHEMSAAQYEINVSELAAGTYFIRITEGTTTSVKSFVKK
jgi:hypothetical protein